MVAVADQLHQYAEAIADPMRGAILVELDRAGEATPTQLARRLEVPANNIYHHMRVLLRMGVVTPPRVVASDAYVEKYYQINPELRAALRLDPNWYNQQGAALTAEDRQARLVSVCLTMATLLRAAANDLQRRDPDELDREVQENKLHILSINRMSRDQLAFRLEGINDVLNEEDRKFAEDVSPRTAMMLMAAIPDMWSEDSAESEWPASH